MTWMTRTALWLGALALATGCDPVWRVNNPATAAGRLDAACIEAGLRSWTPGVTSNHAVDGSRFEFLVDAPGTRPQSMHVLWEPQRPTALELEIRAAGQRANRKAVDEFRAARGGAVAAIERACNTTVTLGPETCERCD